MEKFHRIGWYIEVNTYLVKINLTSFKYLVVHSGIGTGTVLVKALEALSCLSLTLHSETLTQHLFCLFAPQIDHSLTGLHFLYGISVAILALAVLGGFGVYKEKKWALIVVGEEEKHIFAHGTTMLFLI